MSNTFQFLDANQKQVSQDDAAQTFLNEKLSKNKYTQQQQDTLDANGGPTVANASAGFTPPNQEAEETQTETAEAASKSGGIKGSRTADELRKEFGLTYDESKAPAYDASKTNNRMQSDDGHIWYKDFEGKTQYLGQVAGGYERGTIGETDSGEDGSRQGSDKSKFHADYGEDPDTKKPMSGDDHRSSNATIQQAHDDLNGPGHDNGFNSINDLSAAFRHMLNTDAPKAAPKKEKGKPIEHSPEIEQAKERVRSYEDDILSGKTSDDIYGNGADYSFDAAKGAAGIGTPMNGSSGQQASKATASFLDNKKFQVKDKYQFKAQG